MLTCSVCNIEGEFPTVEDLEIHIAMDHIKHLPYECEKCTYARFPTEFAVRYHYKQIHSIGTRKEFRARCIASTDASKKQKEIKAILNCSLRATAKLQAEHKASAEREVIYEECIKQEVEEVIESGDVAYVEPDIKDEQEEHESSPRIEEETTEGPSVSSQPHKVLEQMPCLECGQMTTAQRTSFAYHVNTRHLRRPLFGCLACDKTWMTIARSDVIKHIKTAHGGDLGLIEDNRDLYNDEIRETVKAYFPYKVIQQSRTTKKKDTSVPAKKARKTSDVGDP